MIEETIFALTSLCPTEKNISFIKKCIKSWRDAGLQVCAFNHPEEIIELANLYDVVFIPVTETAAPVFGRHLVPVKALLDWATEQNAPVLIINSDIELRMTRWELKRLRWLSDRGVCYFVRYNYEDNDTTVNREPHGMDAFLFHARHAAEFPDSFLSMGQPFWDYLLPHKIAARGSPLYAVDFPVAFHRSHRTHWTWESWHLCAREFLRISGERAGDQSIEACLKMSARVRQSINQQKISVRQSPFQIRQWVEQKFQYPRSKLFLELGAYKGDDTAWLAEIRGVTIHAFEPDPRNDQMPRNNVTLHRAAITDYDGFGALILSEKGWGQTWTLSSSLKRPKNHLSYYPVTFGEAVSVQTITLDTFCQQQGLGPIDFIWAHIQGAEGEMIRGGKKTLAQTRYLYTKYSDNELYENQITLRGILDLLPDFHVLELWPENVLLENQRLKS